MNKLIQALRYQFGLEKREPMPSWVEISQPILAMLETHKDEPDPNVAKLFYITIKNLSEVADRQDALITTQRKSINQMALIVVAMWLVMVVPLVFRLFN